MTVTHTSKHFETHVALLRAEVSRYIERGICVVDNNYNPESVLCGSNFVHQLCKEIAKQRKVPFVSALFFAGSPNGAKVVRITMPNNVRCKPLYSFAMLAGHPRRPDRGGYYDHPIVYEQKSATIEIHHSGPKGLEAFQSWMNMCETSSQARFALGLPPKVTRAPSVQG